MPCTGLCIDNVCFSYTLEMSILTNTTTDVPALLNHLKKNFEETFEDVSSAKDVKKMIDRLLTNPFPLDHPQWGPKLGDQFSRLNDFCKTEPSEFRFRSIRDRLTEIDKLLGQVAAEADKDDFPPLSRTERDIIVKADGDPRVKCLRVSYEFFLRFHEYKRDPRICLFLAIFPENAVLRKRFLIYWWIGEGLVSNEEEGEKVFEELLDLGLLIPHRTDKCPRVSKCQIFPWIRYMLISEAEKEMLLHLDGGEIPRFNPSNSRRTCLIAGRTNLANESEPKPETLRTIFNVNEKDLDFQQQWLAKLKRLVVLHLGRWQVHPNHHIEVRDESFLTGLKTQKLLKYLSLRGISRITSLPESIKELVSLEILDLKACHNLETLPAAIALLKKLTHLDVSECYLLESLPKGLDNLTSLQVLKGFIIGNSKKAPMGIEHLPKAKLKRLSIHIGSEATIKKEEFDKLKALKGLKCLKLSWGKADVTEYSVSFPEGLQKLDLEGIPHETKPGWLKPSKLRELETLYVKGGKLKNLFDEGEQWNNVRYLVLKYTGMPEINERTLRSAFPSLQYVKKVEWERKGEKDVVQYEKHMDGAETA